VLERQILALEAEADKREQKPYDLMWLVMQGCGTEA
jgi:hypothetical protein